MCCVFMKRFLLTLLLFLLLIQLFVPITWLGVPARVLSPIYAPVPPTRSSKLVQVRQGAEREKRCCDCTGPNACRDPRYAMLALRCAPPLCTGPSGVFPLANTVFVRCIQILWCRDVRRSSSASADRVLLCQYPSSPPPTHTFCRCRALPARSVSHSKCECLRDGRNYRWKGRRLDEGHPDQVYECNLNCACHLKSCRNRLVQKGLTCRIEVSGAWCYALPPNALAPYSSTARESDHSGGREI